MPELVKVTTEMLKNWKPSQKQTRGGSRLYSIKVFKEGVEFEKAGDLDNAAIRYEKARSYCKLKEIPYPPFAITQTTLMQNAKDDKPFVRAYPIKSFAPKVIKPLTPAQLRKAEQRRQGQMSWARVLRARGEIEAAMIYCTNHSLPWEELPAAQPSSGQVVVPEVSSSGNFPQRDTAAKSEGQMKPVPDQSSSVDKYHPVSPPAMVTGAAPKSNLGDSPTLEPVSDWAGEAAQGSDAGPLLGAPVALAQSVQSSAVPAHGVARDVQTGLVLAMPFETGGTADQSSVGDGHVAQGEPAKPVQRALGHETASPAVRQARIWNFPLNKRFVNVKFLDGEQEVALMWKTRDGYRINEPVNVKLERGSGSSAIYEEVRNRV